MTIDWLRIVGFGLLFAVIGVVIALVRANRAKTRRIRQLERRVAANRDEREQEIADLERRLDDQLDAVVRMFGMAEPPRRRPKLRGINGGRSLVTVLMAAAALTLVASVSAEPVANLDAPVAEPYMEQETLVPVVPVAGDRDDADPVRVEPGPTLPRRVDKHAVDDDADEGGAAVDVGRPVVPDRKRSGADGGEPAPEPIELPVEVVDSPPDGGSGPAPASKPKLGVEVGELVLDPVDLVGDVLGAVAGESGG